MEFQGCEDQKQRENFGNQSSEGLKSPFVSYSPENAQFLVPELPEHTRQNMPSSASYNTPQYQGNMLSPAMADFRSFSDKVAPTPQIKSKRRYASQQYNFNGSGSGVSGNYQTLNANGQTQISPFSVNQGYWSPGSYSNVDMISNQFSQMGIDPNMQQNSISSGFSLNPLITVDLIGQHPDVSDLKRLPPPLILPPNAFMTQMEKVNCGPEYLRSTLNAVPKTNSLLKKSRLPFALTIRPFIMLSDEEENVPLVSDTIIARCRRCRSYINPFSTFIDGGHRWKCNLCSMTNDVPSAFTWNQQNKQVDQWGRSELNHSVVDFLAPSEYMVRPPQPLVYVFLIDVSYTAVMSGMVATATRTILESLDRIPNRDQRTKVGFIGVDSALHFFSISNKDQEPSMLVVTDLNDLFLPQPADLLVNISECRKNIEILLEKFNDMFKNTQNVGNAMGPALKAARKLIQNIGGKIECLMNSLPSLGEGKLSIREDIKIYGTSKESTLLQVQNSFYKSLAVECSKSQVTVDMFLFSSNYQDVASLACLPRYTAGQTLYYPGWNAGRAEDITKFAREFSTHLSQEVGLEAVMRVRGSTGLRVSAFYGNCFYRSTDLCAFPSFPRDQGYVVEIAIDEQIEKPFVTLQTAILYSSCHGERRIRVITVAIPTTSNLADVYASADQIAIIKYFSVKACEKVLLSKLEDVNTMITDKLVDILDSYKKNLVFTNTGISTFSICSNLRLLPLLCLCLLKNLAFRKSSLIPSDVRSIALCLLSSLPTTILIPFLHPRFYSLHNMSDDAGVHGANGIILPPEMNLTSEKIESHGLYLVDDGQVQFLFIGKDAVSLLVQDVFGLPDISHLKLGKITLPLLDNPFSIRVNNIIDKLREYDKGKITWPHLYLVKQDGDPALIKWFFSNMIEDRQDGISSYYQYINELKNRINP
ncbi:hypothetical protein PNEG_03238 [Pneumocystis murina B123]|uniref:Protein transport protein SEC24 n=1 Tax=Pneumocystis murina (strain B123) TaxID=1069680 RepID=M7NMP4_PNEMU|nr:hypothetical protein PNEG_03238 [Pneumocystis murina B123]EMR08401.1 hypothetical protein PNEG_03238 [Pneumocystis murina B123]